LKLSDIRIKIILAFVMLAGATAQSSWKQYDLQTLVSDIRQNNVTLLDDLFQFLPSEMKRNALLVYDSRAVLPTVATMSTPRMIFYNRDSSLIFSISRNPGPLKISKGQDQLEIIAFNSVTGNFEIYVDAFNGTDVPFADLNKIKNPKRCATCHGSDPRPLFHNYNGWAGVYGSFGTFGVAATDSKEHAGLTQFLSLAKSMPRYNQLDLDGFYSYPAADKKDKDGNVTVTAGSVGIANGIRDLDPSEGVVSEILGQYKFATPLVFGMNLESLMMKRLAAKLKRKNEFAEKIAPLLYYLGDEDPSKFEVVESRCGHPNDRTKKVYALLETLNPNNTDALETMIKNVEAQVKRDSTIRRRAVEKSNILSKDIDHRGIADIPNTAFFPDLAVDNKSPDQDAHKKMIALLEALLQKYDFVSSDLSTSRETPTTGVFHLSRLGRMAVDEQVFQNLMRGLRWADSELMGSFDKLSCEDVEAKALTAAQSIFQTAPIVVRKKGILYQKNLKPASSLLEYY